MMKVQRKRKKMRRMRMMRMIEKTLMIVTIWRNKMQPAMKRTEGARWLRKPRV